MTKDEALDLALEALEAIIHWYGVRDKNDVMMPPLNQNPEIKESMDAITAIKQARSAPVQEPAEVLGHNGWGFPIKAAAPVQKKCDCAAHSAADCVCGAWDKSAVAPVQEDWGPGPHEYHSLTASVQEPVAWRYRGIFHEFDPSDWAEGPVTPLYTTQPEAQRQWVSLTDDEVEKACVPLGAAMLSFTEVARAIEAKLKEKNNG